MDGTIVQDEIVIRCAELTPEIMALQRMVSQFGNGNNQFVFYKGDTEYYLDVNSILFFETEGTIIRAHTAEEMFETKYKLYELEKILPPMFLRISKSAIVNVDKIYSIIRNISASSTIEFYGSHKKIYVSRSYYKMLKNKLDEKRLDYEK